MRPSPPSIAALVALAALAALALPGCVPEGAAVPGGSGDSGGSGDTGDIGAPASEPLAVVWIQGHDSMDWERAQEGLYWSLGSLGAALPTSRDPVQAAAIQDGRVEFRLHPDELGLEPEALALLEEALAPVRASQEATWLGLDLGRLLLRTVHEPWVYYALTGACGSLAEVEERRLPEETEVFHLSESALTGGERVITLPTATAPWPELAYTVVQPGHEDAEVVDIMPNGRQRFAAYDAQGLLTPEVDPAHNPAGSPGRCMWCHEGRLMQAFEQEAAGPGLSYEDFIAHIEAQQAELDALRAGLDSHQDFGEERTVHAWAELLVESFLHPSAARLGREWGLSAEAAAVIAEEAGLQTRTWEEYGEAEQTFLRHEVDALVAERLGGWIREDVGRFGELGSDHPLATEAYVPLQVQEDSRVVPPEETLWGGPEAVPDCVP